MTNVVELTLVALVSLAANFHAGLENLKAKNYDKAIVALTSVIAAEPSVKDMKEMSLLYRAEAYAGKGNKADAMKDAAALLKMSDSEALKTKAVALYTAQGGVLKDLRPKDGPKASMDKFFALLQNEDFKGAKQLLSGSLLDMLETFDTGFAAGEGHSFLTEIARNPGDFSYVRESFNDTNQTATLSVSVDHGQMMCTLGLVQQNGKWTFSSLENADSPRAQRRAARDPGGNRDRANLMQLGKALKMYSMDYAEAFPAQWEDLKNYAGNPSIYLSTDPTTGKKEKFLYRAGLKQSDDATLMIAASPFAAEGGRYVLHIDGSVELATEENFARMATEQKWAIPSLVKKEDVAKDVAAEVAGLIKKLGDKDSKVRAAAKKRLKEIGAPAIPFLKEQEDNADPEIQSTVRELLK